MGLCHPWFDVQGIEKEKQMRSPTLSRNLHLVMSNAIATPNLTIESFDRITDQNYALVFSSTFKRDYSFNDYNAAINKLTDQAFSIIASTMLTVKTEPKNVFRCIACANTESLPYNKESMGDRFKAVGNKIEANVFMDESDKIWRLEGTGENRRLVRVSPEDLDSILESKRSRQPVVSSYDDTINYNIGDYVYFFNHETAAMDYGYAVESNHKQYVFTRSSEKLVELRSPLQVIVANEDKKRNPLNHKRTMVAAGDYSINGYLDYVKKLYGSDNPYYKALEAAIRTYVDGGN